MAYQYWRADKHREDLFFCKTLALAILVPRDCADLSHLRCCSSILTNFKNHFLAQKVIL